MSSNNIFWPIVVFILLAIACYLGSIIRDSEEYQQGKEVGFNAGFGTCAIAQYQFVMQSYKLNH